MSIIKVKMRRQCVKDAVQAWLDHAQPGLRVLDVVSRDLRWRELTVVIDDGEESRDSNPHSITVVDGSSGGDSALARLAASMSPGTWARLDAGNQDAMLGVGPTSGTMIHYCNQMPWNAHRKAIEICAMDHAAGMQRYVRYLEASNTFELVQADDGAGSATRHGYGHNTVNPFTGDLYHRLAEYGYEASGFLVRRFALDASEFADLQRAPALFYMQNAIGSCWWSGAFDGAGEQGCLLLYNSGDSKTGGSPEDGGMYAFDPLASRWFASWRGVSPFYGTAGYTYHSVMAYSAKHNVAVYGGGNDNPTKLWRMASDRSVVQMPDTPAGSNVGIQQGIICDDPVTGHFLLLSRGKLWQLDPTGNGTWTEQTGSRVPPSAVGDPAAPDGVTCTPIPFYGVVAYITQTSTSGGCMHLYKHA